jgi:5-methylthioadenosine/S-adenosylhomocysteine deaminase
MSVDDSPHRTTIDLLVHHIGRLVTMDESRTVLIEAAVAVKDGRIEAVGSETALRARYRAVAELDADGGWLLPGLIDAHQHLTGDRLARASIPDDIHSGEAIFSWAVPLHGAHSPDDDELSATLACLEAVTNGVTTIIEAGTVAHPERVVAGIEAVGVRASIGRWGWDVEQGPYAARPAEVVALAAALLDRFPPDADAMVQGWVTLVGHDLMSDELVVAATDLARSRGAHMTYHLSPTDSDPTAYLARTGRRPVVHLDTLEVLGPHLLLAHGVHLDDTEVEILLERDVAVAACPWAYLRLGQGVGSAGRYRDLLAGGARLALGCDSENAGDQIDVLRAAALFAGLAKDQAADPAAPGAACALELATIRGAAAIGRGHELGSIEVGKRADLVVLDVHRPEWTPPGDDVALQLVWGTDGRSVVHVVVAGRVVVRDGRSTQVDLADLAARAERSGIDLRARAGVAVTALWPTRPA